MFNICMKLAWSVLRHDTVTFKFHWCFRILPAPSAGGAEGASISKLVRSSAPKWIQSSMCDLLHSERTHVVWTLNCFWFEFVRECFSQKMSAPQIQPQQLAVTGKGLRDHLGQRTQPAWSWTWFPAFSGLQRQCQRRLTESAKRISDLVETTFLCSLSLGLAVWSFSTLYKLTMFCTEPNQVQWYLWGTWKRGSEWSKMSRMSRGAMNSLQYFETSQQVRCWHLLRRWQ